MSLQWCHFRLSGRSPPLLLACAISKPHRLGSGDRRIDGHQLPAFLATHLQTHNTRGRAHGDHVARGSCDVRATPLSRAADGGCPLSEPVKTALLSYNGGSFRNRKRLGHGDKGVGGDEREGRVDISLKSSALKDIRCMVNFDRRDECTLVANILRTL